MYTVEKIEVILTVPSIEETAAWYERVLGWTGYFDTFDAEGRCSFGSVMHGDMDAVMRGEKPFTGINLSRFQGEPSSYNAEVSHFTAPVYDRVMESGIATPGSAPENQPWGGRTFRLRDLNGFALNFVQMVEQVTLEEVRRRYEEQGKGAR